MRKLKNIFRVLSICLLFFVCYKDLIAIQIAYSEPNQGNLQFPTNSQVIIEFNANINISNLADSSNIDSSDYAMGKRIPFYIITKDKYDLIPNYNYLKKEKISGHFVYNSNRIVFTPNSKQLKYNTDYVIVFNSWDTNAYNIEPLFFRTIETVHKITSISQNLYEGFVAPNDSINISYNRSLIGYVSEQ